MPPPAIYFGRLGASVVVVGGEEKAAAAWQAGYSALCPLLGESVLHARWCQWLIDGRAPKIILAHDHDDAGEKATKATIDKLIEMGCPKTRIARIRWDPHAAKGYDLNDVLRDGMDLSDLLGNAEPVMEPMSMWRLDMLAAYEPNPSDRLLADNILAKGEMLSVIGPPGAGKSRLIRWLGVAATTGRDWCGLETNCLGSRWLFFQNEDGVVRVRSDILPMVRGMNKSERDAVNDNIALLMPLKTGDRVLNLGIPGVIEKMRAEVLAHRPDVVVFDPMANMFSGESENDARQMLATISEMVEIVHAWSAETAGIIIHHAAPGRESAAKADGWDRGRYARGSTALYGSVRAQINIGVGGPDVDDALIIACGKNNNGRMFSKRAVRLDEHSKRYLVDPDFDWDAYKQSMRPPDKQRASASASASAPKTTTRANKGGRPSKQESIPDSSVLSLVKEIGQTSLVDAVEELSEIYDVSRKTAQRRIEMLADTGLINIDPADGILAARFLTRSEEVSLEL